MGPPTFGSNSFGDYFFGGLPTLSGYMIFGLHNFFRNFSSLTMFFNPFFIHTNFSFLLAITSLFSIPIFQRQCISPKSMSFLLPVAGQNFPPPNFPAIVLFYNRIPLGIFKVFSLELGDFSSPLTILEIFGTASPELRIFLGHQLLQGLLIVCCHQLFKGFTSKFGKFLNPLTHLGIFGDYLQNWECLSPPYPSGMHVFFCPPTPFESFLPSTIDKVL